MQLKCVLLPHNHIFISQHSQNAPVSFKNRRKIIAANDLKRKIALSKWSKFLQIPIISMFAPTFNDMHTMTHAKLSLHSQKLPVSFKNRCKIIAANDLKRKIEFSK
jgi:hypothetical protein